MIKCVRCGTDNPDTVRFCAACGTPLRPASPPQRPAAQTNAAQYPNAGTVPNTVRYPNMPQYQNAGAVPNAAQPVTPGAIPNPTLYQNTGAVPNAAQPATPGSIPNPTLSQNTGAVPNAAQPATPGAIPNPAPYQNTGAVPGAAQPVTPGAIPNPAPYQNAGAVPNAAQPATPGAIPNPAPYQNAGAAPNAAQPVTPGAIPNPAPYQNAGAAPNAAQTPNAYPYPNAAQYPYGYPGQNGMPRAQKTGRSKKLKPFIIGAGGLAVLAVLIVVLVLALGSGGSGPYLTTNDSLVVCAPWGSEEATILHSGKPLGQKLEGTSVTSFRTSSDGNAGCIIVNGSLYGIAGDSVFLIDENADAAVISLDGSVISYRDRDNALYSVRLADKKRELIAPGTSRGSASLSQKGNTVLFSSDGVNYCYKDGNAYELPGDYTPDAALDDGSAAYLHDRGNNVLYYVDNFGKNTKKISASVNDDEVYYTADAKEVMYVSRDRTFVSRKGGESIKVSDQTLRIVYPYQYLRDFGESDCIQPLSTFKGVTCTAGSYYSSADLGYIDDGYKFVTLSSHVSAGTVRESLSSNRLFYLKDDTLCCIEKKKGAEEVVLAEGVRTFEITENGETVFWFDDYSTLYRMAAKKSATSKEIDYDANEIALIHNTALILEDDGTLVRMEGERKETIADGVNDVGSYGNYAWYYITDSSETIYAFSADGKEFSEVRS